MEQGVLVSISLIIAIAAFATIIAPTWSSATVYVRSRNGTNIFLPCISGGTASASGTHAFIGIGLDHTRQTDECGVRNLVDTGVTFRSATANKTNPSAAFAGTTVRRSSFIPWIEL